MQPDRHKPHHHGQLREAALVALEETIREGGVGAVTVRAIAARTGVSHPAVLHHFGTINGLFTAFAIQGFEMLGQRVGAIAGAGGSALDVGVEYVGFSVDHPAHFQVMFTPSLLVEDEPALQAARERAFAGLGSTVGQIPDPAARSDAAAAVIAGWSLMHGLAVLSAGGNLEASHVRELVADDGDLLELARRAGRMLFGPPGS